MQELFVLCTLNDIMSHTFSIAIALRIYLVNQERDCILCKLLAGHHYNVLPCDKVLPNCPSVEVWGEIHEAKTKSEVKRLHIKQLNTEKFIVAQPKI